MNEIAELLDRLARAAVEHTPADAEGFDGKANLAAAIAELRQRRRNTPEQIAEHRRLHRAAKMHVELVDKHNAENPHKPMTYRPNMLAYLHQFSYVEKDT